MVRRKSGSKNAPTKVSPKVQPSSSEMYTVEKILGKRGGGEEGKIQIFVKWQGYPSSENSWVDLHDLTDDLKEQAITLYNLPRPAALPEEWFDARDTFNQSNHKADDEGNDSATDDNDEPYQTGTGEV